MDQRILDLIRGLLARGGLHRLVVEDELCARMDLDWSRAAVAVQWLIEEGMLVERPDGSLVEVHPAARPQASAPSP